MKKTMFIVMLLVLIGIAAFIGANKTTEDMALSDNTLAKLYMENEHSDVRFKEIDVYECDDEMISFMTYDDNDEPVLCASINRGYYTYRYTK